MQDRLFCCLPEKINMEGKSMSYYSDPTAAAALGNINREFSRLEKRAKNLRKRYKAGQLSDEALKRAQSDYRGIYAHVLANILEQEDDEEAK